MNERGRKNPLYDVRPPAPPEGLERRIMLAVARRERRLLYLRLTGSGVALVASMSLVAWGASAFAAEAARSGLFGIASFAFSDFGLVAGDLKDFGFSLIESFPMVTGGVLLAGLMTGMFSFAALFDEARELGSHRFSTK